MNIIAISDLLIPEQYLKAGLAPLVAAGHDVTVLNWDHPDVETLQEDNLAVEHHGPEAVTVPEEIVRAMLHADGIITQFCPVPAAVIRGNRHLKFVGVMRGGVENVDTGAAANLGVPIINTPGRNGEAVAEFAVGLMLAETRNIARSHQRLQAGSWDKTFPNSGSGIRELASMTVGLVGAGNVASRVARILAGFGSTILFYDPFVQQLPGASKVDDLSNLLRASDIVSTHSRLTPETNKMIGASALAAMGPHSVLINTARAGLVDEEALLDALERHNICSAAIDAFNIEPLPANSRWTRLNNVTITPHLAGSTADAFRNSPVILAHRILEELDQPVAV